WSSDVCSSDLENDRFIPESDKDKIGEPEKTMERSPGIHEEWVAAAKGNGETSSNFQYAAALTETMLLGNAAVRFSDSDKKLQWDADNMRIKNLDKANKWLNKRKQFRNGYREILG